MIPRRNQIAIGAIVTATLALAAFWVYTSFELYEIEPLPAYELDQRGSG